MAGELVLISAQGNVYYVRSVDRDCHTKEGFIAKAALAAAKPGSMVESNTGTKFALFPASFPDRYRRIGRGPQIIPRKDLAFMVAETGMGKESIIVDAGSGSGAAACFFANIAKEVFSYDVREDHILIAQKNAEQLGLRNLTFKNRSVYEGIDETNVDVVLFDLPEPWKGVEAAKKALAPGGFLISYSPTTPQVQDFVSELSKHEQFIVEKVVEVSEREWDVMERKVRPKSQAIGHSGFMVIARKVMS